ncbi:hypothetical protein D3C87_1658830 [compost metagenome]
MYLSKLLKSCPFPFIDLIKEGVAPTAFAPTTSFRSKSLKPRSLYCTINSGVTFSDFKANKSSVLMFL